MTQKIVDELIQWYEDTIRIILYDKSKSPYLICVERSTQTCICDCFAKIFNYDLSGDTWIQWKLLEDFPNIFYWYAIPDPHDTLFEIIHKLQVRINILKEFPN